MINSKVLSCLIVLVMSFYSFGNTSPYHAREMSLGVQLWSVKNELKQDFKGTLSLLANAGFEGVEFAGYFGQFHQDPAGLEKLLTSLGLRTSGAHVSFQDLSPDNINNTLSFYQTLGAEYLIIPWDERSWSPKQVDAFIAELNQVYSKVSEAGFAFGYHNHSEEFTEFKHHTFWDHIAQKTNPKLVLQLDIGWVNYANKDPASYVKKYRDRTLTTHLKIRTVEGESKSPIIGQNDFNWLNLIDVMHKYGGTKWLIIEQEEYILGLGEVKTVVKSKQGLDKQFSTAQ